VLTKGFIEVILRGLVVSFTSLSLHRVVVVLLKDGKICSNLGLSLKIFLVLSIFTYGRYFKGIKSFDFWS
jgi:hypothetical protein